MRNQITMVDRPTLTAMEIRAQVNLIQEVMKAVMKKDEHYGIIPGCLKPSLYKAGAEKLLVTFRIAPDPVVLDLSTPDEARFRVAQRGLSILTGVYLGSGIGECSSNEEKFRWRAAVCDEEFAETPEDRRREKYKKNREGKTYKIKQIRTVSADVANTVLKMADKRAYVALALKATAASDIFTQDIEDLSEGMTTEEPEEKSSIPLPQEKKPAVTSPATPPAEQKKTAPTETGFVSTFVPVVLSIKEGKTGNKSWTKFSIKDQEGMWFSTFDAKFGNLAQQAKAQGLQIKITWRQDGEYANITNLEVLGDAQESA